MPDIKVTPLGAGQDVGRSCILVSMGGKNIMLDCGMHMGFNDERRFPDFSYIVPEGPATNYIDCVIISHFHLDHCGALPYFTEMVCIAFQVSKTSTGTFTYCIHLMYSFLLFSGGIHRPNLHDSSNKSHCANSSRRYAKSSG